MLPRALEVLLTQATHPWRDDYQRALGDHFGEQRGEKLYDVYAEAFSVAYQAGNPPHTAALDTGQLEALTPDAPLGLNLYRPKDAPAGTLRLKVYLLGRQITLSEVLPMLENMGAEVIDERPYEVHPARRQPKWIRDVGLRYPAELVADEARTRELFQGTLAAVWSGQAENDGFNSLSLGAGLGWREIAILRAYCKFLRQAGTTLSQAYIEATLARYPHIARDLVALFHAQLSPTEQDAAREQELVEQIEAALNHVPGLDEDKILRRYLAAIRATQRTNYYRRNADGSCKNQLALKLLPAQIPNMPLPLPAHEIFVYSPRFEGVHLRGGDVARGGIRWSDRSEDFRTEVLGLLKAQVVKNSIIVPVGAKGSFCPKLLPAGDREAIQKEVRACYSDFIRGLLDVTDNRVEGQIVPPADVVRRDGDDSYLVVAADKGTATFSDIANGIAEEYGFWLRDAFASGGKTGYSHKAMSITARGGWVSVKRHFRELGLNVQEDDFTAVGVGDMSGDVFGNGMLMSRHVRLIGAFDHRHIFIDPDPDAASSYEERQRLALLPGSSWDDYDRGKLSEGGGVWPRTAKSIALSPQIREALGIGHDKLSPNELIHAVLRAPVDLLWNGGIGTYVKAASESHADVGDKNNDPVRVDGRGLRCRVVAEGGNLGFTQLGRIEYALKGGRINTDAIDNSGGVGCSDREVNIKILLNQVVDAGELSMEQRNRLLVDMTDDVARLVLLDNKQQNQTLSLTAMQAPFRLDEHGRLIRYLEREAGLDRSLEFLPTDDALQERAANDQGLTRPELAILLSYVKIHGFGKLVDDPVLDEPELEQMLFDYFPQQLSSRFPQAVREHQLRREIMATALINLIVNRMGLSFLFRQQQSGASIGDIARAYLAASQVFDFQDNWDAVDALDNQIPAQRQNDMLLEFIALQERASAWLLRNLPRRLPIADMVQRLKPAVDGLSKNLEHFLPADAGELLRQNIGKLQAEGVPPALAAQAAAAEMLYMTLDIAAICHQQSAELEAAAHAYFSIGNQLGLSWLLRTLDEFNAADSWAERMRAGLESEVYLQLRELAANALTVNGTLDMEQRIASWMELHRAPIHRLTTILAELHSLQKLGLPMLAVAVQELRQLVQHTLDTELANAAQ
jgi:glutamate dehydrogenase